MNLVVGGIEKNGLALRRRPTLPTLQAAVPSALEAFTAVFGMGTGGALPP